MIKQIYTMLVLISAVGFVVLLAYGTTVLIGKKSGAFFQSSSVKVLERVPIGQQANITIIQIQKKVYILSMQSKNVEVIDVLDAEEWHSNKSILVNDDADKTGLTNIYSEKIKSLIMNPIFKKGDEHNYNENDKHK
ncbi:flagellar biosynthetic protein FliO [Alkaliphilus peptidifermentans]|uniref:Flagellar biosynthesis protein, FliO n=1 Tax=Alkaliphilus peptidifermentans DSM 18978 TaxID=1120976 RepID=A0A1G5DGY0_9FIRM|nr:flagellar biosynthetic protein FliO [Alkaliphilus peptidifermentans]SCY13801.1 Flagellar biosynthesis protein, FliO [Alkaliphilus peptidifermentans DSM 18978]